MFETVRPFESQLVGQVDKNALTGRIVVCQSECPKWYVFPNQGVSDKVYETV